MIQNGKSTFSQCFPKNSLGADVDRSKRLHAASLDGLGLTPFSAQCMAIQSGLVETVEEYVVAFWMKLEESIRMVKVMDEANSVCTNCQAAFVMKRKNQYLKIAHAVTWRFSNTQSIHTMAAFHKTLIYFSYFFSEKTGFDTSCKLST